MLVLLCLTWALGSRDPLTSLLIYASALYNLGCVKKETKKHVAFPRIVHVSLVRGGRMSHGHHREDEGEEKRVRRRGEGWKIVGTKKMARRKREEEKEKKMKKAASPQKQRVKREKNR